MSAVPTVPAEDRSSRPDGLVEDERLRKALAAVWEAATETEFLAAERGVHEVMRQRADEAVAAVLTARCASRQESEGPRQRALNQAKKEGVRIKSHGWRPTCVRLLGGSEITLLALEMLPVTPKDSTRKRGQRGPNGAGVYPLLDELGIVGRSTPALRARIAMALTEADSVTSARALLLEHGLDVPHKVALRLAYMVADASLAWRTQLVERAADPGPLGPLAGKRVVALVDGGRLRVKEVDDAAERTSKGRKPYKTPWVEPKVLTIYVVGEDGSRDLDFQPFIDATLGNADEVFELLTAHLLRLGALHAAHLHLGGDGADWIRLRGEDVREKLGLPAEKYSEFLDYFHAVEYLGKLTSLLPDDWDDDRKNVWLRAIKNDVKSGRIDDVICRIEESTPADAPVETLCNAYEHLEANRSRMNYPWMRERGLPIGSGAVESAVRRVVNLRLKGNSIFWLREHAEGMLHLRAYLKAGRWSEVVQGAAIARGRPP